MANQRLSKTSVDAIPLPVGRDSFVWDTELRGFGVRTTPKGVKSFVLQYRLKGKPAKRMTIGGFGNPWTVDTARKEAERRLIKIRQGIDPKAEAREQIEQEQRAAEQEAERIRAEEEAALLTEKFAFANYADVFRDQYLKIHWVDTWKDAEGILKAVRPYLDKVVHDITRADVVEVLDRYNDRPGRKKMVHSVLRKFFNWSVDRGDLDRSPIDRMKAPKPVPARRRVLSAEEIIALWQASADLGPIWRPCIRLLLCTLARREEVANMDWSEIDLTGAVWELPEERAKNNRTHRIPLNALAQAELRTLTVSTKGLVFTTTGQTGVSGFSKMKKALDEKMLAVLRKRAEKRGDDPETVVLMPWRIHDLRRTGATNLQALGMPIEVTEAVLNHISGTTSGIAGVYNLYRYEREKQSALDKWSKQLSLLLRDSTDPSAVNEAGEGKQPKTAHA